MSPLLRPYLIGGAVGVLLTGAVWWYIDSRRRPVVPTLPPEVVDEMVPIETVPTLPGPPSVVEHVKWKTRPAEIDPEAVKALALMLCAVDAETAVVTVPPTVPQTPRPEADIVINADKHVGREGDRIVAGWVGEAACRVRAEDAAPWVELAREPFDQSTSVALSEIAPRDMVPRLKPRLLETAAGLTSAPGARLELRWYREGTSWGLWSSVDWVPPAQGGDWGSRDTWTVAAGVSRRWGKR